MRRARWEDYDSNPLFLAARLLVRLCNDENVIQAWVGVSSLPKRLDFMLASPCVTVRPMTEHVGPHGRFIRVIKCFVAAVHCRRRGDAGRVDKAFDSNPLFLGARLLCWPVQ